MRRIRLALGLALLALVAGAPPARASSTVIVVSLDGTTPAQIRDPGLPALGRLAEEGALAERLIPVFPTNTFPNHATLVTGVAPERHGVVNNVFLDPVRGRHSYDDDPSWLQAEPLWSIAARHGVVAAAYHWVGSQGPWTSGFGPRHWKAFDAGIPAREKVDQILAWLDLEDPRERPRLITTWFRGTDKMGHRHGPDSKEVRAALRPQDAGLGRLLEGLEQRGLLASTTLLVVSDHGMAPVQRTVHLAAALRREKVGAELLGSGGFATLVADDEAELERALAVVRALGLEGYRREQAPDELRLGNPRFGDAVVLAAPGVAIVRRGLAGRVDQLLAGAGLALGGAHGYRPQLPAMAGVFLAFGAGVEPGARPGPVRALDVAPTVLALLGVPIPAEMEGEPLLGVGAAVPSQREAIER